MVVVCGVMWLRPGHSLWLTGNVLSGTGCGVDFRRKIENNNWSFVLHEAPFFSVLAASSAARLLRCNLCARLVSAAARRAPFTLRKYRSVFVW